MTTPQGRVMAYSAATSRRSLHPTTSSPLTMKQPLRKEQVLEETDLHSIKARNSPVPVQVKETLRSDSRGITLKLHYSGWAWLVCGNHAYFWKHSVRQTSTPCHQVSLPTSKAVTGWSADLVTVQMLFEQPSSATNEIQGVLAVSPEGVVRYWKCWSGDQPHSEGRIDVGSDHVHSVTNLETSVGFVAVTGSASFYVIKSPQQRSQPMTITHVDSTRGIFSGIGRRVSSMFWGGHPSETRETLCVTACFMECFACDVVYVMTRTHLQRWKVDLCRDRGGETLMQYEINLKDFIMDSVVHALWFPQELGVSSVPESELRVWPLDCAHTSESVAVLFAISHWTSTAPVLKCGIACINMNSEVTPLGCCETPQLLLEQPYQADDEPVLPPLKIVGYHGLLEVAVYDRHHLFPVHLKRSGHVGTPSARIKPDKLDFPPPNGIVGAGAYLHELLFFTVSHGVVSVTAFSKNDAFPSTKKAKLYSTPSLLSHPRTPSSHAPPSAVMATPADNIADETEQLKSAFMLYLQDNMVEAASLCAQYFPDSSFATILDTPGDLASLRLSEMVLNDLPTGDPRWGDERVGDTSGVPTGSIIILYQLQDKLEAHNRYIQFLTDVGLLDKLTCSTARGRKILTRNLLCEHAEKIVAAIALRQGGREDMKERKVMAYDCVEQAIKKVLHQRPPLAYLRPGLGTQDIFFSQVASVDQILSPLVKCEEEKLMSDILPADKLKLSLSVASVLESILHEVVQYRMSKAVLYARCVAPDFPEPEYYPWTGTKEIHGIISIQLQLLMDTWVESCQELSVTDQDSRDMWVLYADLADILFQGFREQLASIQTEEETEIKASFEQHLNMFILPLLDQNQFSLAGQLAERYEHFPTLVRLYEKLDNAEQLQDYFKRFSGKGFNDYLFKYYLDQGKIKKLLSFADFFPNELGEFLRPHRFLPWLHYLGTQEYSEAAECLCEHANSEQQFVTRKQTLFSLGKLSILASDDPDMDKLLSINSELTKLEYQKKIPVDCLEQMGYQPGKEPPLSPRNIVELYVGDSNMESEVIHFLFALEFLDVALPDHDDVEAKDLRLYIWSQAVIKNDWSQLSGSDDPLELLQQTFFFQVVAEAYNRDLDVVKMLPELSHLLHCSYLKPVEFAKSAFFHYLMHAGYEQVQKLYSMPVVQDDETSM